MSKITEVQIKIVKPKDGLVGFASIVLDEKLYLGSIGVFTKLDGSGYRITYPTKKAGADSLNVYHPITEELGKEIELAVVERAKELFQSNV